MRQRIRKGLLVFSALLFPLTFFCLSPFVIVMAASQGVLNASAMIFGGLLVTSVVSSRLYCGWLCPGGAVQDAVAAANPRQWNGKLKNGTKYLIWLVWFGFLIFLWVRNQPLTGDFFYRLEIDLQYLMIYAIVMAVIFGFSLLTGKRGMCHSFCWMAPFMVLGEKLADLLHIPRFRLKAEPERCIDCGRCSRSCPMSLDVAAMVQSGHTDSAECIQCLTCVDTCPKQAIGCGIYPKQRPAGGNAQKAKGDRRA